MSLEQSLTDNTAAVKELNANIERLLTLGPRADAGATETKGKTTTTKKTETTKSARSQEEVVTALQKLMTDFGKGHAKDVIKTAGGVEKMADIPADKFEAVYTAACAKYDEMQAKAAAAKSSDEGL